MAYEYIIRHPAPRIVEFYCKVGQYHRVIRVMLDLPTPRILAYNESSVDRSPAQLWLPEIIECIETAKEICDAD